MERPPRDAAQTAPGWQKFETEKLDLWLPDSYIGGDPRSDLRSVVEQSKKLGPMYQFLAKATPSSEHRTEEEWRRRFARQWSKGKTKEGAVEFFFSAFDSEVHGEPQLVDFLFAEVRVWREKVGFLRRREPLQTYLLKSAKDASSRIGARLVEQTLVRLGPYESGRLVMDLATKKLVGRMIPAALRQLSYVIRGRGEFWGLQYTVAPDNWDRLLPVFEESASTLRLKEVDAA